MSSPGPAVDPDAAWVPPRSPVPILPAPAKGILKARPHATSDVLEPEMIRGHERDPDRPTVRFTLAAGHRDRNTRGGKKRKGPSFPNSMRRGLDLYDLQARYVAVCKHLQIEPLSQILYALEDQINAGTNTPPHILDLRGVEHVSRPHSLTIAEYIVQNGSLREVNMAGIGLRDDHLEKLCQAVAFRRGIERINLSDNARIGPMGFAYIGQTLARSVFLSYLNLSGCTIKTKSAEILNIALPKSKLRTLIMHRVGLKNPKTFGLIASGCADSNSLSSISFKSNCMSAKSIQHVQVLLGPSCILETLDLRSNLLGDAGAQIIATALSTNTRLTKLILFDNKITHFGASCIYQALQNNTALETLDISNNLVGRAETMDELKRFLMINLKIVNLFLWKIGMGDSGSIILGEALAENRSLQRVEVRNNALTVTGYLALSHALRVNEMIFKMLIDVPENTDPDKQKLGLMLYQSIQHSCGSNLLSYPVDEQAALGNGEGTDQSEVPLPAPAGQPTHEPVNAADTPMTHRPTSDEAAGENLFEVIIEPDEPMTHLSASLSRTNPFLDPETPPPPLAVDGGEPTAASAATAAVAAVAAVTAPVPALGEALDEVRSERRQTGPSPRGPSSFVPEEREFVRRQTGPSISREKTSNPFLDLRKAPEQLLGGPPAVAAQVVAATSDSGADPVAGGTEARAVADAGKPPDAPPALDTLIQAGLDDLSDEDAAAVSAPSTPDVQVTGPADVGVATAAAADHVSSELTSAAGPDSLAAMTTIVTPDLGDLGNAEAAVVRVTAGPVVANRAEEPAPDTTRDAGAGPPPAADPETKAAAEPAAKAAGDSAVGGPAEAGDDPVTLASITPAVQPDVPGRDVIGNAIAGTTAACPDDLDGGEAVAADVQSEQPDLDPQPAKVTEVTAEQISVGLAKLEVGDAHSEAPKQLNGAHEKDVTKAELDSIAATADAMIAAQSEHAPHGIEADPVAVTVNDGSNVDDENAETIAGVGVGAEPMIHPAQQPKAPQPELAKASGPALTETPTPES